MPIDKALVERINELHERAMDVTEEADFLRRRKDQDSVVRAMALFEQAFRLEFQAAELVPTDLPTTEIEPTRSVLYQSAMHLANDAGLIGNATTIAQHILGFSMIDRIRADARLLLHDHSVVPARLRSAGSLTPKPPTMPKIGQSRLLCYYDHYSARTCVAEAYDVDPKTFKGDSVRTLDGGLLKWDRLDIENLPCEYTVIEVYEWVDDEPTGKTDWFYMGNSVVGPGTTESPDDPS